MNLAYRFPIVYWNAANLIVDSGGVQTQDDDDEEEIIDIEDEVENDEDEDEEELEDWEEASEVSNEGSEDKKKKKVKNVDYGKLASTIGRLSGYGIKVSPPDINKSSFTFTPVVQDNAILYGLRGIARISSDKIKDIMDNRPYSSLEDFLSKNNLNKIQVSNLIKSGAFDAIEGIGREEIMKNYLTSIADSKQKLTLQNMAMLIAKGLIPDDMKFYEKLFLFNKYLKNYKEDVYYTLSDAAINYISNNFSADYIINGVKISQSVWDALYKKSMKTMSDYLKKNQTELLDKLNKSLYDEVKEKYGAGNISKWEMDSISFYYHEHELAKAQRWFDDFFALSENPEIDYSFISNSGQEVKIYKLHKIIGTVIDKDKMHDTVTLLTPTGVVLVKVYKNQFAMFDKQLSQRGEDGKKHIVELSWFKRGTKLMVQGIRRGNDFIPKKMKNSLYPIISKITDIDDNGDLKLQTARAEVNE